jgi:Domain of unknown function (DUF4157)
VGTESASADAERKKAADSKPAADDKRMGTAAAGGGAAPPAVTGAGLGERQLQKKAVVGGADDESEKKADQTADQVMRMADPTKQATPTPQGPAPAAGPAPGAAAASQGPATEQPVRRAADPATEQKVPGTPTAKPVGTGSAGGAGPDTATPAGPAPMVSPPIAAGSKPAETGTPAPEPEPPAPAGEAPARGTPAVSPELQDYLDASRGKGAPLPDAVRKEFEAKFQRPFDDVRIHDDAAADDAARRIDALAFTRGNDIYFRSGAYDPTTPEGRKLLAHELAHVVQQRPGVNRKSAPGLGGALISRATTTPAAKKPSKQGPAGSIEDKRIKITNLSVPMFKKGRSGDGPFVVRKGSREENPTRQGSVWRRLAKENVAAAVKSRLGELNQKPRADQTAEAYYLTLKTEKDFHLIGTEASIANDTRVPVWDKHGKRRSFDIDHKREAQLGGKDEDPKDNLWLLDSGKNRSAGVTIKNNIDESLRQFLAYTAPTLNVPSIPSEAEVWDPKSTWILEFENLVAQDPDAEPHEWWEVKDLAANGDLMKHFDFPFQEEVKRLGGSSTELAIYDRVSGGGVRYIKRQDDKWPISNWKTGEFEFTSVEFSNDASGKVSGKLIGTAFKEKNGVMETAALSPPIKKVPGVLWGGVVTPGAINYWRARAFSPISFPEPEFDIKKGIVGRAVIDKPSIKLLENVEFAVVFDGDVSLRAEIYGSDLKLPGPFKVTGGSLIVSAGTGGVGVTGDVFFELSTIAKGHIGAGVKVGAKGTKGPAFSLAGELNFDTKMFNKASLGVSYKEGEWGVSGELAVTEPGKIKGIKSASATVEISSETVTAKGEFEPSIKGIKKGSLGFRYDEKTGTEITGEILLGEGIPGIKSGKLAATIKEGPDKHSLSGDLSLEPSVPGLTGEVKGRYDDGMFSVDAHLGYEKGFAKGTVHLGVTNQPIGADGKPAGAPKPDGSVTVYGEGTVTLQLTPWLTGTVGLKLTPDGQVEVSGEVALPPTFNVFDEKKIEKELLSIHVDIPIIGVAVAGQRIGIFASIGGAVRIEAGVGPGQLRDVALKVTYNPAKPEATTVTGNAKFAVPAHAALRLSVDGSVGAGIPVVSAKAGLEVFGEIGVAGEASAATAVTWTPSAGVVLDARGEIYVEPKFKFGINAFVDVSADLWVTTIELYHETWKLAQFEYGSNLRFGLALPVHYESGKPFDISYDQIQWTYPHIEPMELISGLVKQIVG